MQRSGNIASQNTYHPFWWFFKLLGAVYLCAFVPLWFEIDGLIGNSGLLPANKLLEASYTQQGVFYSFLQFPSVYHFFVSNATLYFIVALGCVGGIALLFTRYIFQGALLSWILFLSITTIGGDFFVIIVDLFLLEVGFLTIVAAWFWQYRNTIPNLVSFAFRLLNFRLWFCMGIVKFYMPAETWTHFTFFDTFFQAQPMPTPMAWYFHKTPLVLKYAAEVSLFIGEIIIPFFVFGGKKLRWIAFVTFTIISVLIEFNGNYGYFNVLSIVLALTLLKVGDFTFPNASKKFGNIDFSFRKYFWQKAFITANLFFQIVYSITVFDAKPFSTQNHFNFTFLTQIPESKIIRAITAPLRILSYWRISSPTGVFKSIPAYHGELRFSGSEDGIEWSPYIFRFVPSSKTNQLLFFAPYYPRLDHVMFYETLAEGAYKHNPLNKFYTDKNAWISTFVRKLFLKELSVEKLLKTTPPFAPKFIKVELHQLFFDDKKKYWAEGSKTYSHIYSVTDTAIPAPLFTYEQAMSVALN